MNEQQKMSAGLGCATLVAVFFLAVTVFGLSYQTKPSYFIQVGSRLDQPYMLTFFDREHITQPGQTDVFDYRFTRGSSTIDFPGIGSQPLNITLRVNSSENPNPQLKIYANDNLVPPAQTEAPPPNTWKELNFSILPGDFSDGNLHLRLESSEWKPKGDSRTLGILVDWIKVEPAKPGFLSPGVRPPDDTFIPLVIIAVLFVLIFLTVGIPAFYSFLLGCVAIAGISYWLIFDRLSLTAFIAKDFLRPLFFAWVVAYLAMQICPPIFRFFGVPTSRKEAGWLAGFFLLSFILLFGGQLDPQFLSSDIGLHVNILLVKIMHGTWVFTEDLPNLQPAPYPPGYYIGLLPFTNLLDGTRGSYEAMFKVASSVLQASGVFMVFYLAGLLWRSRTGRSIPGSDSGEFSAHRFETETNWGGILAAGFYSICKYPFYIMSQGNHANFFGEWAFLLFLCVVAGTLTFLRVPALSKTGVTLKPVTGQFRLSGGNAKASGENSGLKQHTDEHNTNLAQIYLTRQLEYWRTRILPHIIKTGRYLLPLISLFVAFMSHYGTFLFTNVFIICLILALLLFSGKTGRREALYLAIIYFSVFAISFAVYYYNFIGLIFQQASNSVASKSTESGSGFPLPGYIERTLSDTRIFFGFILCLAALGGIILWIYGFLEKSKWRWPFNIKTGLSPAGAVILALGVTSAAFMLMERIQGMESRYQLYFMTLVILAAGYFLGRIWRSGFAGVLLVSGLFLFQLLDTLSFWLDRLTHYF